MTDDTDDYLTLTDAQREYAASILNEHENDRKEKIAEMRQWIFENKDLHARTGKDIIHCPPTIYLLCVMRFN